MRLFNQGSSRLRWTMGGRAFECAPYGEVDVPESLVPFIKSRGLPLDVTPLPDEVKASKKAFEAKRQAESSEVISLKRQLGESRAAEKGAKDALEVALLNVKDLQDRLELSGMECDDLKRRIEALEGEKVALEKQLSEQAKLLAELEAETAPKTQGEKATSGKGGSSKR